MRVNLIIWCALITSYPVHVSAMANARSSQRDSQTINAIINGLAVVDGVLSPMNAAITTLHENGALRVATLQELLDVAESSWKPKIIWGLEKIIHYAPAFTLPYLGNAAGKCHPQGQAFIQFLIEQDEEKKSLTDLLQAVRYGMRHAIPNRASRNHFLSSNEKYINGMLNEYHPLLPALTAGVNAMRTTLVKSQSQRAQRMVVEDAQTVNGSYTTQSVLTELAFVRQVLRWARNGCNECKYEQEVKETTVFAEYESIDREITAGGYALNNISDDVFYDAESVMDMNQFVDVELRAREGREEGMGDWLK